MKLEEIKKLADLARIDMSQEEMEGMAKDFEPILAYVGQVQEASKFTTGEKKDEHYFLNNVTREDIAINIRGEYTKEILDEMPETQDGFLKVKKIL